MPRLPTRDHDGEAGMRRASLRARLRARLDGDERGFTIVETVVAITVIFGSLVALAYTATIGFGYADLGRQKQTATGIADEIMEQVRGLPWERVTAGHLASDITTADPNVKTGCEGDAAGVYRLFSCSASSSRPGSGEKVVMQATTACTAATSGYPKCVYPLILHSGSITQNNIAYTWRVYDTNNCPTTTSTGCPTVTVGSTTTKQMSPYRITVVVTWTGGKAGPNKVVQAQSLFWSPSGCRSTATHPFAAPCQPFFLGVATVPKGNVHIAQGSATAVAVSGTSFVSGDLDTAGVESTVQSEQLSYADGGFTQPGVRLETATGATTRAGIIAASSAADTDPGTTSPTYSSVICPDPTYPCAGGAVSTGSENVVTLTAPGGQTARSTSTTSASTTNVCPPPTDTAQTDGKACGGSTIQSAGILSASVTVNSTSPSLGSATIAQILASSGRNKTFVDRVQSGQTPAGLCAPITNSDGCIEATATRRIGTVNVGAMPSAFTPPSGWSGSDAWNGYYFSIVGYQDAVSASAGTNSTSSASGSNVAAPAGFVSAGSVYCWNGSGYNPVLASSTTAVTCTPITHTQNIGSGHTMSVTMSATTTPRQISLSPTSALASQTDVTAQVRPPSATIMYQVSYDGLTVVDLTITVDLGTLEARGSYAVAPTTGT